jgi:hypothetical protein
MRVLEQEDYERLNVLTGAMPKLIGGPVHNLLSFLFRPGLAGKEEKSWP